MPNKYIKSKWLLILLATFVFFIAFMVYEINRGHYNSEIIPIVQNDYVNNRELCNSLALLLHNECIDDTYVGDTVEIEYFVKTGFAIGTYRDRKYVPKYEHLNNLPLFLENISFFRNCFRYVYCYEGVVGFQKQGLRTKRGIFCALVNCREINEHFPYYKVFQYGRPPSDNETNCLYHLEGDWYICLP